MNNRFKVENKDKHPAFAFILTLLFSVFVLLRPQEIFPILYGVPVIAVLSVLTLIVIFSSYRPIKLVPQHYFLLALYPVVFISGVLGWNNNGLTQANFYFNSALIPLIIFSIVFTSANRQTKFMWLSLIISAFLVHNGHVQQNSADGFGWSGSQYVEKGRITYLGILGDPNDLGIFFILNIPFALYFFKNASFTGKLLSVCALSWLFYGIYMTNSRGAMIALSGVLAAYFIIKYGGVKAIISSLILAPVGLVVMSSFRAVSSDEASAKGRLWAWWDGLEMLKSNPIWGVGSGNFLEHHGRVAHNTYVQIAAELGLTGYILWSSILFLTLYLGFNCIQLSKTLKNSEVTAELIQELQLNATLFYSLCGFAMCSFFLTRNLFIGFYMIAGMLIASYLRIIEIDSTFKVDYSIAMKKVIIAAFSMLIIIWITLKFTL
jgi:O-antigen ligase